MTSSISSVPAGRLKVCNVKYNTLSGLRERAAAGDCVRRQRDIGVSIKSNVLTNALRLVDMRLMSLLAISI